MDFGGYFLIFVDICGYLWIFVDNCGYLWIFVGLASSLIYQLVDMPAGTVLKPGVEFLFGVEKT